MTQTSVLIMTQKPDGEASVTLELWGNAEYPFIAIAPRSTLVGSKYGSNRTVRHSNRVQTNDLC